MAMRARSLSVAAAVTILALTLHGCGDHDAKPPTPAPAPTPAPGKVTATITDTTTTSAGVDRWNLAPIEVRGALPGTLGNSMYDSVTNQRFVAKGIGMPDLGDDLKEWIPVLDRIAKLSDNKINVVRIYRPPECALTTDCFEPFMRAADKHGIYVVIAATGTQWGWLPGSEDACTKAGGGDQGCYEAGGVLGFGKAIVQRFNYPNTLAIVVGNEFDMQMRKHMAVLKAYTRDLKKYMAMCNTANDSPTHKQMRQIPLMYASSDDHGNLLVSPKANYLFCGDESVAVDMFGLNVERWCADGTGKIEYTSINKFVEKGNYPGAFVYSEMGCGQTNLPKELNGARAWTEVPGFFKHYMGVQGFVAYVYYGNTDFNMFDGANSTAKELQDGKNFFRKLEDVDTADLSLPTAAEAPRYLPCDAAAVHEELGDYKKIKEYETGEQGEPVHCPKPYQVNLEDRSRVVV